MNIETKFDDSMVMTRSQFRYLMIKHPRTTKFGFSKKHTEDILRSSISKEMPSKIFCLPVEWNTAYTYFSYTI